MNTIFHYAVRSIIGLAFLIASPDALNADDTLRASFLRDYRPVRSLVSALERGFAFSMRQVDYQGKSERVVEADGVMVSAGFFLRVASVGRKNSDGTPATVLHQVELGNEAYDAMLEDKGGSGHVIVRLTKRARGQRPNLCLLAGTLYQLNIGLPFAEAVKSPGATVERYEDDTFHGRPVKVMRLSFGVEIPNIGTVRFLNDYYFAPGAGWLCVGYRERSQLKPVEEKYAEVVYSWGRAETRWVRFPPKSNGTMSTK